jgi:hypothetical protein
MHHPIIRQEVGVTRLPLHHVAVVLAQPDEADTVGLSPDEDMVSVTLPRQPAHLVARLGCDEAGKPASATRDGCAVTALGGQRGWRQDRDEDDVQSASYVLARPALSRRAGRLSHWKAWRTRGDSNA